MKKITFSITLSLLSMAAIAQKTILVNGGLFNNNSENVSIDVYDTQTNTLTNIDSIGSQSVQDVLIDGAYAYVAAQDSIVRYDLTTNQRVAATKFQGVSTKTMVLAPNDELVVANWYGRTSNNVYIYDQNTLALKDSINIPSGIKSMVEHSGIIYATQNSSTGAPNYNDTLGAVVAANVSTRSILITYSIPGYTGDIGELILNPDGLSLYSINGVSNSINKIVFPTTGIPPVPTNTPMNQNFKVSDKSDYTVHGDTAFLKMNQGIGAIDLNTLNVLDSIIVDTVVTAFTYDTLNHRFYVTQTDFFSYKEGKVYDRNGSYVNRFHVGSSPEVIRMYYNQTTGLFEINSEKKIAFSLYPNPVRDFLTIDFTQEIAKQSSLSIFNMKGQQLLEVSNLTNSNRVDISDLAKGIYLVTYATSNEMFTQKLIVE